jgi:Mn-dependent DtxR family transcriptional regulator
MGEATSEWTFFSNYAHVLVCLAEDPQARLRDVAARVDITERTAVRLISQLDKAGILKRVKDGRRNSYVIDTTRNLRHPIESHCTVGAWLATILGPAKIRSLKVRFASFDGTDVPKRDDK